MKRSARSAARRNWTDRAYAAGPAARFGATEASEHGQAPRLAPLQRHRAHRLRAGLRFPAVRRPAAQRNWPRPIWRQCVKSRHRRRRQRDGCRRKPYHRNPSAHAPPRPLGQRGASVTPNWHHRHHRLQICLQSTPSLPALATVPGRRQHGQALLRRAENVHCCVTVRVETLCARRCGRAVPPPRPPRRRCLAPRCLPRVAPRSAAAGSVHVRCV